MKRYRWIEFKGRPKRDGLHDSGYRFIQVRGARQEGDDVVFDDLHRVADHILLYGPANIDIEPDGRIRIMPWSGKTWVLDHDEWFGSDAIFYPEDWDHAMSLMRITSEFHPRASQKDRKAT